MIRLLVRFYRVGLTAEGRLLMIAVVVVGIAGISVRNTQIYLLWTMLAGLFVASLLGRPWMRLRGVGLTVHAPKRVQASESVAFLLELHNRSGDDHDDLRLLGPVLGKRGRWTGARPAIVSLGRGRVGRVVAEARFDERGEYHLGPFTAHALAPFGFALGRPVTSDPSRLLVIPRIAPVRRLRIPETARYQPGGVALASKTGESMELLGVRPYRPGDPVRDLHPKSWARTGYPVVREYQQEYFSRIGIILDTDLTVSDRDHLEVAISLAAGVVAHVSRGEALIDLLVVGHDVHPLTLGRSLGFLEQALDLLACVRPGPRLSTRSLVRRIDPYLGRLSSVVLIALAFDDPRRSLVDRIRHRGVACRSLVVETRPDGDSAQYGRDVSPLTADAIRSGDSLLL